MVTKYSGVYHRSPAPIQVLSGLRRAPILFANRVDTPTPKTNKSGAIHNKLYTAKAKGPSRWSRCYATVAVVLVGAASFSCNLVHVCKSCASYLLRLLSPDQQKISRIDVFWEDVVFCCVFR